MKLMLQMREKHGRTLLMEDLEEVAVCQGHSTHNAPSELKTRKSSQSYWCLGFQTPLLPVGCPSTQKTRQNPQR